jgi:release factor glutamine methyltransferase
MKLLDVIKPSSEYLEKSGIDDPLAEAELLVFHAAGIDKLAAYINNPEVDKSLQAVIRRSLRRRAKGEPLQYIIGHVDFLGLAINVGRGVLIPRPETELLALEAIKQVRGEESGVRSRGRITSPVQKAGCKRHDKNSSLLTPHSSLKIVDLCTGSGCIALALAREFPSAAVYGTDISKKAIRYAKKNAATNGMGNAEFLCGSLFEPVEKISGFDLIVSNPPYVKRSDISGLQREIRDWEPWEALDGGRDGLDWYRRIFSDAGRHLKEGAKIILELGFGQAAEVSEIARKNGLEDIEIKKDYSGIERILKAEM